MDEVMKTQVENFKMLDKKKLLQLLQHYWIIRNWNFFLNKRKLVRATTHLPTNCGISLDKSEE